MAALYVVGYIDRMLWLLLGTAKLAAGACRDIRGNLSHRHAVWQSAQITMPWDLQRRVALWCKMQTFVCRLGGLALTSHIPSHTLDTVHNSTVHSGR
jgi:hypothetical protein